MFDVLLAMVLLTIDFGILAPRTAMKSGALPDHPGDAVVHRNGWPGPIDEYLLARLVFLPEYDTELAPPLLIGHRNGCTRNHRVRLPILLPEQP